MATTGPTPASPAQAAPDPAGPDPVGGRRGVIHDIGYRHYEGARLGRGYLLRSLYSNSLRAAYGLGRSARSKVLPVLLLGVMCVTALILVVVAIVARLDTLPLQYTRYFSVMSTVIGIYLAAQAPQLVSRDLRFHVVPLYFSRPLTPAGYALAKYGAMATAVFVLTASPLLILYAGAILAKMPLWQHTKQVLGALGGVALLSLLLAGIGLLLAALTPRRGFGVASVMAVLLIGYTVASIVQAIAVDQGALTAAGWFGLLSPFTLVDGVQVWALGVESSTVAPPHDTLTGVVFLLVALAGSAASLGLLAWRYRTVAVT
jgi:ABC-2 type transport system permease protein